MDDGFVDGTIEDGPEAERWHVNDEGTDVDGVLYCHPWEDPTLFDGFAFVDEESFWSTFKFTKPAPKEPHIDEALSALALTVSPGVPCRYIQSSPAQWEMDIDTSMRVHKTEIKLLNPYPAPRLALCWHDTPGETSIPHADLSTWRSSTRSLLRM